MKVAVSQEKLAQGLSIVSRAVSPRSTLPVLANIMLATDQGRLLLSATNLEMGITCWIGAEIEEEGAITIPARTFSDLVGTLPRDRVYMDLNTTTLSMHVRCGTSNTDIKCIGADEFPPRPDVDLDGGIVLNVADLKEMIRQVVFSASSDEARPVLTGVLVTIEENQIKFASADGYRLSVRSAELSTPVDAPVRLIIPARALAELARIASDPDDIVRMYTPPGRGQVIFRMADIELVSQLIEGNFPDFQQVIPRSYETRSVVSTDSLLKACKQAEIFARESSHIARININGGSELQPGTIEIFAQSEETGSNETVVDASIEGPSLVIAFNVSFLRDVLEVVRTPNVALETSTSASPGIIRPLGENNFLHVIMPMHI